MFYGIIFKIATLGQFLEIFILICLISHSQVIFELLLFTVHEVPTTPPCALTPVCSSTVEGRKRTGRQLRLLLLS